MEKIHNKNEINPASNAEIRKFQIDRTLERFIHTDKSPQQSNGRKNQFIPIPFELLDNHEFRNNYIKKKLIISF